MPFFSFRFQSMEMKLKIVEGSPETIFAKVHRNARSDWYMKKHLPRRPPPFPGPNARPGLTPQEPLALTEEVAASKTANHLLGPSPPIYINFICTKAGCVV